MNTKENTTFDNTYIVEDLYISDLLNNLDDFKDKMDSFITKYPNYKYDINVYKEDDIWIGEVKVIKDEQKNN